MSAKRASVSDYFSEPLRPHQDRIVESHRSIKFDDGSEKTRCLVVGGVERYLEAGPFDRVVDPKEDFDVILAISPDRDRTQDFEIDLLMARCSNPAAPLIADSGRFGPRADIVLSDIAPGSIASALLVVQPLLERLHDLPRLPDGVDRDGLLALTLAYTRDIALEAKWAPNSESMLCYPMLLGLREPRTTLEELAASGLLRRRFFERLFVCGQCRSSRMMAREVCVKMPIEPHRGAASVAPLLLRLPGRPTAVPEGRRLSLSEMREAVTPLRCRLRQAQHCFRMSVMP